MNSHRYEDAAKSIFALCPGITAIDEKGNFAVEVYFILILAYDYIVSLTGISLIFQNHLFVHNLWWKSP